jgi:hypothetical protein
MSRPLAATSVATRIACSFERNRSIACIRHKGEVGWCEETQVTASSDKQNHKFNWQKIVIM